MGHYSDPTAARALGSINREFAKQERKAKRIYKLYQQGRISAQELEQAHSQFSGIYKHVLTHVIREAQEKEAS